MDNFKVVIKPLVTEQGMHFASARNSYSFQVHKDSNKAQIKNAIEKIYNVKVDDVRTANRKGKPRRRGRFITTTSAWKKAVVVLKPEYHIDLF